MNKESRLPGTAPKTGIPKERTADWLSRLFWAGIVLAASWWPTLLYWSDLGGRSPQNASLDVIFVFPLLVMLHIAAISLTLFIFAARNWTALTTVLGCWLVACWGLFLTATWWLVGQVV